MMFVSLLCSDCAWQESGERYVPLNHFSSSSGKLEVVSSNLSEFAVMGFEYGCVHRLLYTALGFVAIFLSLYDIIVATSTTGMIPVLARLNSALINHSLLTMRGRAY